MARKPISSDDLALWGKVTAGTEPLKSRNRTSPALLEAEAEAERERNAAPKPRKEKKAASKAEAAPALPHSAFIPAPPNPALALDDHPRGRIPGLDRRTQQKLQRGQMPIDATIDLHGMTQAEAHSALNGFIDRQYRLGRRCVLVITGKGSVSVDGSREPGVLRKNTPRWLSEPANRDKILGHASARQNHGGSGAMYVLLRKPRS